MAYFSFDLSTFSRMKTMEFRLKNKTRLIKIILSKYVKRLSMYFLIDHRVFRFAVTFLKKKFLSLEKERIDKKNAQEAIIVDMFVSLDFNAQSVLFQIFRH